MPDSVLRATFVANLKLAAFELGKHGIKLLIEPINHFDIPGFYLNTPDQAASIIAEVGSDNLYIQYDLYHQQRTEGELIGTFKKHQGKIPHVQLADNPGRNEPGTGEIAYPFVFKTLDALGYDPVSLDALLARTGLDTAALQARLLELELDGQVGRLPGGLFQRMGQS